MTGKLPILSGKDVIKALVKLGYTINDQKGSHIHLRHPVRRPLTVPNHPEIARGTLRIIIMDADLTIEKFLELL
ncbi:type II toxin-antitoxin system HicA family toxin [Methanosphaerula palustris]|uniref:YcfA family protein n=1 Tax=Methanosphaerula palustris (strain ATCC BAA-1556 / DSM 19958 / E1-9c) TaxID=521011 RepID=B8GH41_METPE|nr:type II toxin-antitoxin system HicA family toxin [Methanosphaerula palustris]ACL16446.1 YcfA family protein [Methanosphaerula palustris E1-9c]